MSESKYTHDNQEAYEAMKTIISSFKLLIDDTDAAEVAARIAGVDPLKFQALVWGSIHILGEYVEKGGG